MSRFSDLPPLMPDEPLNSYVSRIARCHGTNLSTLCVELGIPMGALAIGRDDVVERLHALTGAPVVELTRHAFQWRGGMVLYNGQTLRIKGFERKNLKVCPLCLREDAAASDAAHDRAAYLRGHWLLSAVRTCTRHHIPLVAIEDDPLLTVARYGNHDIASRLARTCHDLDRLCAGARHEPATRLEAYAADRLRGHPTVGGFADGLPFYAAIRTAEMLGIATLFGPRTVLRSLDWVERRAAGEVGFDVVRLGAEAIASCLAGMVESHVGRRSAGANKIFGLLYHWMKEKNTGGHYDEFRSILRQVAFDHIPLAAGTDVLGEKLDRRRIHSLQSAACEAGRGLRGMRRDLRASGIMPTIDSDGVGRMMAIRVDAAAATLGDLASSLPRSEASTYLNASIPDMRRLVRADLLHPLVPKERSSSCHVRFSRSELNGFLLRLMRGVTGVAPPGKTMVNIPTAAGRTTRSLAALTSLVMRGELLHVGRLPDSTGFRSVLVDVDEIRSLQTNDGSIGVGIDRVAKILRITRTTVFYLMEGGDLKVRGLKSSLSEAVTTVVEHQSLNRFSSTFVSLSELSAELDIIWGVIKAWLDDDGVAPAFPVGKMLSVVYRRSDLATLASRPRVSAEALSRALGQGTKS